MYFSFSIYEIILKTIKKYIFKQYECKHFDTYLPNNGLLDEKIRCNRLFGQ